LTPDANNRATTKDILRHDWLSHGPVLSLRLNSTPTPPITSSTFSLADPQSQKDYEKVHLRITTPPTTLNDKTLSPTNSLLELELHTSSFFDTAKLRDKNSSINKEQQRRNRASAIPDSTRYYTSNNSRPNSSTHPTYRRPLSLSLDDQHSNSPIDYHFASTSEKPSQISSPPPPSSSSTQTYNRRSRRTVSPASTKTTSTYGNHDRTNSPQTTHRYTLTTTPETTKRTTSPINPSRYLVSYDFDTTLHDIKRKPIYKYTPPSVAPASELNVVPSLLNSTTPIAPSVFTTSAIKFAPAPTRRMSPFIDQESNHLNNSINSARLLNNTISNQSSNIDDSINIAATTNHNNRRSLLTSYDLPSGTNNIRKSRLLDDNNNLISLKVHD
jgi:hypothetical protein